MAQRREPEARMSDKQRTTRLYNGQNIIVLKDNHGMLWFKATQIAQHLGYSNTNRVIQKQVSKQHKKKWSELKHNLSVDCQVVSSSSGLTLFLNKDGFYHLALQSQKPEAVAFRNWLVQDVIKSLEETGTYTMPSTVSQPQPESKSEYERKLDRLDTIAESKLNNSKARLMSARAKLITALRNLPVTDNPAIKASRDSAIVNLVDHESAQQAITAPRDLPVDLSEICREHNIAVDVDGPFSLQAFGRHVAKMWRQTGRGSPTAQPKFCNGSYRPCKVYPTSATPEIARWIRQYIQDKQNEIQAAANVQSMTADIASFFIPK